MSVKHLIGDVRERLKDLADESVHCVVTSPPYFGLRDYGTVGQIGLESTPEAYVAGLVAVFREVRRVLRKDGTLWLNLGDSYNNRTKVRTTSHQPALNGFSDDNWSERAARGGVRMSRNDGDLKEKDLCGIPWMMAFALRADGWYLRQDIIWAKPNPMPESVRDRCTKAHEYVFLLTKSQRYFYDAEAVSEPVTQSSVARLMQPTLESQVGSDRVPGKTNGTMKAVGNTETRNRRSVWTITTKPYAEAHFATFPPELPELCIKAGTSERGCCPKCGAGWVRDVKRTPMLIDRSERTHERGRTRSSGTMVSPATSTTIGWSPSCLCKPWGFNEPVPCLVLDPFSGAGTTGMVADRLGRNAILIELNPEYAALSERRLHRARELALDLRSAI